jgi:hypothetical protein
MADRRAEPNRDPDPFPPVERDEGQGGGQMEPYQEGQDESSGIGQRAFS